MAYCIAYMRRMMEGYEVEGDIEYGPKRNRFRTPDVLVGRGGELSLVVECKAKGGVLAMTRKLAEEGGVHNIRANTISPGMTSPREVARQTLALGVSESPRQR